MSWFPTMDLRWIERIGNGPGYREKVLQQRWEKRWGQDIGGEEWRDIPIVGRLPSYDFHAEEWFEVKSRGLWAAAVTAGRTYDRNNVRNEIAAHGFTIDGRAYTLIAVERYMPATPIRPGEKIALMIKELPPNMKLPESEGPISAPITSTETAESPARQSGSPEVDPSGERQS